MKHGVYSNGLSFVIVDSKISIFSQ